jgi:cytochrome c2
MNIVRSIAFLTLFLLASCTPAQGDPAKGERLFKQKTIGFGDAPGCSTCHSILPEEVIVGPSLFGVHVRAQETINLEIYAGEASSIPDYLEESILTPDAFVREGFSPGVMYQGFVDELTEEEILDLVAFLDTLK